MVDLPGKELARELLQASQAETRTTPFEAVIDAARAGQLDEDAHFRLIGRLWALERYFYYIYGGWAQGLEVGDYPPGVKYLFARQIHDESTHEMMYMDAMLSRGWIKAQPEAFRHPYGKIEMNSMLTVCEASLRYLATYTHPIRLAGVNLGVKVIELDWMERLAPLLGDANLEAVFSSQLPEIRSHINMGRRVIEECVSKPFDAQLCRFVRGVAIRDYSMYLHETADIVLRRPVIAEAELIPPAEVE